MLNIVSIEAVASQGMTKPLICRADDGGTYLVKYASGVTVNGLVKEWLAAHFAQEFGFKVPEFDSAFLYQELIDAFPSFAKHDVVSRPVEGVVFVSKWQVFVDEFKFINVDMVPLKTQHDLLVFDLWIGNDDRNLTGLGGNVNLLWLVQENDFIVIDHNLAFEYEFQGDFLKTHVFRSSAGEAGYAFDLVDRQSYQVKLQSVLDKWDNYLSDCPKEWLEHELFDLDLSGIYQRLLADAQGALWDRLI